MVLFTKSATTSRFLAAYRAVQQTQAKSFAQFIKPITKPAPKVPHPDHSKSANLWRNLFYGLSLPVLALVYYNAFHVEDQHPPRPEFKNYEYMRRRVKKFPWGDGNHSLFHNDYYNALPEGYELPERAHGHGHH